MSEAEGASSVTPAQSDQDETESQQAGKHVSQVGHSSGGKAAKGATNTPARNAGVTGGSAGSEKDAEESESEPESDLEEINLGGNKYKVQKGLTENLKQWERSVQAKMQQAAKLADAREKELLELLKTNPQEFAKSKNLELRSIAEQVLLEDLKRQAMSPEEIEREELRAYKAAKEQEEKERQEAQEKERLTRAEQQEDREMRSQMIQALNKSGLPADPYFAARAAATMMQAQAQGVSFTWDECVAKVERDFRASLKGIASKLEPQGIQDLLGEEVLKKWRQFDVTRVSDPKGLRATAPDSKRAGQPVGESKNQSGQRKPMSEKEFFEFMGGM